MSKYLGVVFAFILAISFASTGVASADGASLWKSKKCKNCHKMTAKKKVGPGLAGVTKRRSEAWLLKWLQDPQGTWAANDAETQELKKWAKGADKRKKTKMKTPKISEAEAKELIAYMKANGG